MDELTLANLVPGGHMRILSMDEWHGLVGVAGHMNSKKSGMTLVTSPLGAPIEVLYGSVEFVLCVRNKTAAQLGLARRLARREIAAEAAFNEDRIQDFEEMALAHAAVVPHILSLAAWSPRRTLPAGADVLGQARHLSRNIAARRSDVLTQAQHMARSIAARRAAMEALL